jgi:membrane protease YdiL (CAAX protease family)
VTEPAAPFPGPLAAIWLTLGSWLATGMVLGAFLEPLGPISALGLGLVLGLGIPGTLAARRVPPPQAERMGLRGFAPRVLPALLLLLPLTLLASEIDNVVQALVPVALAPPAPEAATDAEDLGLVAIETAIVLVGLAPVVEEFFFRGVLQQGLVTLLGAGRGIFGAALLYALGHGNLVGTPAGWLSAILGSLLTGTVLGYVRLASGSLLASILLSMAFSGAGFAALSLKEQLPIPGFNGPGDHTPLAWLLPAAASVALGLWLLSSQPRREPPERVTAAELSPPRE